MINGGYILYCHNKSYFLIFSKNTVKDNNVCSKNYFINMKKKNMNKSF